MKDTQKKAAQVLARALDERIKQRAEAAQELIFRAKARQTAQALVHEYLVQADIAAVQQASLYQQAQHQQIQAQTEWVNRLDQEIVSLVSGQNKRGEN